MIKKTLYFILKSPFDIKILKFFFWFFGHFEKRIDAKNKINLKIPDVITWETIAIYILPNIPRSKSNQLTKFGKLIEHVMRNIFLKKIIHKTWWISSLKFLIIVRQFESYRNVLKLNWRSLAFISSKAVLKNKKRSGAIRWLTTARFVTKNIYQVIFF